MKMVACLFCLGFAATQSAAEPVGNRFDILKCQRDSVAASMAMVLRQMDKPGQLSRAKSAVARHGPVQGGVHLSQGFYLTLAYRYDVEGDVRAQQARFAEAAVTSCIDRLDRQRADAEIKVPRS